MRLGETVKGRGRRQGDKSEGDSGANRNGRTGWLGPQNELVLRGDQPRYSYDEQASVWAR